MATSNSFVSAARGAAGLVDSGKGELAHGSTGVKRLDAFGSLNRTSDEAHIDQMINAMYSEVNNIQDNGEKTVAFLDIFRIMIHKRAVTRSKQDGGEGERHLFYLYFLRLYDDYPDTLISMVTNDVIPHYGYWKDYRYIWKMICENGWTAEKRFAKYDKLICAMRDSILSQRSKDLVALSNFVRPHAYLSTMSTEDFKAYLNFHSGRVPSLNMCGKFCVREKGADNKKLYWYVRSSNGKLLTQSHTSFMVRASLKRRDHNGAVELFPTDKPVPFATLKTWRLCNAKLNTALGVVENYMSAGQFSDIDPSGVTSMNNSRYMKAFLNEKRKGYVESHQDTTGNRHPDNQDRVSCRQNFRNNTKDISKINVANLFPHQISSPSTTASSTAQKDRYEAMWSALVNTHSNKLTAARATYADELSKNGASSDLVREALLGGNFVGCCDISGSMGGFEKESPLSLAIGLTAFASEVASEPYRDLAITFSANPHIYSFKNGDGSRMNLSERISKIGADGGLNTDYYKMHCAVANLCKDKRVDEKDMPIIIVFTDGAMDSFDTNASGGRWLTTHEKIRKMYVSKGFNRVPTMVIWNLSKWSKWSNGYASKAGDKGYIQLQGRSPSLFKYIMYGEGCGEVEEEVVVDGKVQKLRVANVDPYMVFRKAMDNHKFFKKLLMVLDASDEAGVASFKLTEEMFDAFE